jgi:glycosyltransferase involved in cell wall biosynthesis
MIIGIDGSRAFLKQRTGIEEYSYQVICHLRAELGEASVRLYVPKKLRFRGMMPTFALPVIDFELPATWRVVGLWSPRFWTKFRLSLEMFLHQPDVLFVPAHTLPLIGAKKNIVVVHGLEYEVSPESYSWWERLYMRLSIRHSCRMADEVIVVSENTKRDVMRLYGIAESKLRVVYEGYVARVMQQVTENERSMEGAETLLFIGRLETRKNVARVIEAFEILKKTGFAGKLLLVGRPGFGYEAIAEKRSASPYAADILEKGFVSQQEKEVLLGAASVFVFPSLYEGFGLPVLEAQAAGVPVVTSNTSSLPEVTGDAAVCVDPTSAKEIAAGIQQVLRSKDEAALLKEKGYKNIQRFSWERCAKEVARELYR